MFQLPGKLRWVSVTRFLLLSVAFIPLIHTTSVLYPYIVPRTLLFEFVVALALFCALQAYREGGFTPRITRISVCFGLVIAFGGLATLASPHQHLSFFSTLDRMEGFVLWCSLWIYFFLLSSVFVRETWKIWCILNLTVGAFVGFVGLSQNAGGLQLTDEEGRIDAFFGNPIFFGAYMLSIGTLALVWCVRARTKFTQYSALIVALIALWALIFSGTRSIIIGSIVGFFITSALFIFTSDNKRRALTYGGGALVFLTLCIGGLFFFQKTGVIESTLLKRFEAINLQELKTQARYFHYEAAIDGIIEKPFLGYGFEGFTYVFERFVNPEYYGDSLSSTPEPWSDRVHNEFLDLSIAIGVPGAICFILVLVFMGDTLLRNAHHSRLESLLLFGALCAYIIHMLFNFSALVDLLFLSALAAYVSTHEKPLFNTPHSPTPTMYYASVICLLLMLCAVGTMSYNRFLFAKEMRTIQSKDTAAEERLSQYISLGHSSSIDALAAREEVLVLGTQLVQGGIDTHSMDALDTSVRAIESLGRALGPLSPRDLYYYGTFYRTIGAYTDAERVFTEGLTYAPERLHLLNGLSLVLERRGAYDQAREIARRAYELEPTYDESTIRYASTLIVNNEIEMADTVLLNAFGSTNIYSTELVTAYQTAHLFERAVRLLEGSLMNDPMNKARWELLLTVLLEQGDTKAFAHAKKRMQSALKNTSD